jgi:DNA-binding NarL/FixJ family response regulator
MKPISILLVDDHAILRAGIASLLQSLADIEVVAQAGDGAEALRLMKEHEPDVALMDIAMQGMNGLEATARANKEYPRVRVIILSMHTNEVYALQALRAGATGYLLKDAGPQELETAIRTVVGGELYLTPTVSKYVVADYVRRIGGGTGGETNSVEELTPRQREILQLIASGHSTQEIAKVLFVSTKTVETHRAQMMERLGIYDVAGLTRYAIRTGLVHLSYVLCLCYSLALYTRSPPI